MSLQDIKYVMSVDDNAAKQAISRTVKDLKTLDNSKFGAGADAENLIGAITAAGESAGEAVGNLGAAIGSVFGGSVLGNAVGDAMAKSVSAVAPAVTGAFAGLGVAGGTVFAKSFGSKISQFYKGGFKLFDFSSISKEFEKFKKFEVTIKRLNELWGDKSPGPIGMNLMGFLYEARNEMPDLINDLGILRKQLTGGVADAFRKSFSIATASIQGTKNVITSVPGAIAASFGKGLDIIKFSIFQLSKVFDLFATGIVRSFFAASKAAMDFAGAPFQTTKRAFASLSTTAANAWASVRSVSMAGVFAMVGAVTIGTTAILGAFAGIAAYANSVWSEVEDGIMAAQAAMVGFGASIDDAFSDDVANRIMSVADTLATGLGAAPAEVAAATAQLMKNGMDMEQALGRMALVQNIATVNGISMADAAEKVVSAWSGEVRVLKDLGIRMKATGDLSKDAEMAMAKLMERYGDPNLSKPFIDDNPIKAATAAFTMLWAKLGQALDPAMTAAWQAIADVILGISESLKDSATGDFLPNVEGVLAAIGATVSVILNATVVVSNVFQMVWTGIISVGQSIWYGVQFGWSWIEDKLASLLNIIGEAVSLIPGTGDAGSKLRDTAKSMQESAKKAMDESGKNFTDAAMANFDALKRDAKDIANALAPDGGVIGDLQRKGQAARDRANNEAIDMANNATPLGESDKVREERERKWQEEQEKRAKKQKQVFEQNQRLDRERSRMQQQRTTIVLQTPQRMIPALRHAR